MSLDDYEAPENRDEWHAVFTVQLGELIENGWVDWSDDAWSWDGAVIDGAVSQSMHDTVCDMINEKYYWREISIPQPGQWRQRLLYRIKYELVPKYQPLYQQESNGWQLLADWDEWGKERNITSAYPETLLSANSDYLESGQDREFETVHDGNMLDNITKYIRQYRSLNQAFVDELEPLFLSITSNGIGYF